MKNRTSFTKFFSLLLLFLMAVTCAEAQNSGTFTCAALNVDGLPKQIKILGLITINLNPDAKESVGASAIGKKANSMGWDFFGVSEDFNFNKEIFDQISDNYSQGTHRGKVEATASAISRYVSKSWPLFDTDGLNMFWKKDGIQASGEKWTKWDTFYGTTEDGADGLIDKGYRYYCMTVAEGIDIDVYILHMDAETSEGDLNARDTQLRQLAAAIIANKNGRPIIVMGDTNCRYTRDYLKSHFIDIINADPRLTIKDAWIEKCKNNNYPSYGSNALMADQLGYVEGEIVDKMFYINVAGSKYSLTLNKFLVDTSFVDETGEPLADHFPVVGTFRWSKINNSVRNGRYYVRNKATGKWLNAGGSWGTHAVLSDYPHAVNVEYVSSDSCVINTGIYNGETDSYLTRNDPYMDGPQSKWAFIRHTATGCFNIRHKLGNRNHLSLTSSDENESLTISAYSQDDEHQLWEFLTEDDMKALMANASVEQPYNATYLLPGANFNRNDSENNSWQGSPAVAGLETNCNAEKYNAKSNTSVSWDVYQTLSNLPEGYYQVYCQAFYRDGSLADADAKHSSSSEVIHGKFYAHNGQEEKNMLVHSLFDGATENSLYESAATSAAGYVPNNQNSASAYFSEGKYECVLDPIYVKDGGLRIGISKDKTTTESWTCFDNFRLMYFGTSDPTAVNRVTNSIYKSSTTYDLMGRPVRKMQKGLYILDGKKVMIR